MKTILELEESITVGDEFREFIFINHIKDLSSCEKKIVNIILNFQLDKIDCYLKTTGFVLYTGCHPNTIRKSLNNLKSIGLVDYIQQTISNQLKPNGFLVNTRKLINLYNKSN